MMIRFSFLWPLFTLDFILHFSRALTFTFFPIYLSQTLAFNPLMTGYALGGSLVIATVAGVWCGMLVDRFTPQRSLFLAILL
jgi:MFS family permease